MSEINQVKKRIEELKTLSTNDRHREKLEELELLCHNSFARVSVIGGWSSGKSTLLNSLLELDDLLPSSATPDTSVAIEIEKGNSSKPSAEIIDESGHRHDLPQRELKTAIRRVSNHLVRIKVDRPLLNMASFIDTPGDNSTAPEHQALLDELLKHTTLTLYTIRAERSIQKTDRDRLLEITSVMPHNSVRIVFTCAADYGKAERESLEQELSSLFPELDAPLWWDKVFGHDDRNDFSQKLSGWISTEGEKAHYARVSAKLTLIEKELQTVLKAELIDLKASQAMLRFTELEQKSLILKLNHMKSDLITRLESSLKISLNEALYEMQVNFDSRSQDIYRKLDEADATSRESVQALCSMISELMESLISEAQNFAVLRLADLLDSSQIPAELPRLNSAVIELDLFDLVSELDALTKSLVSMLADFELVNQNDLMKKIDDILIKDTRLKILVEFRRSITMRRDLEIEVPKVMTKGLKQLRENLTAWWADISANARQLLEERLAYLDAKKGKELDADSKRIGLEIESRELKIKSLGYE